MRIAVQADEMDGHTPLTDDEASQGQRPSSEDQVEPGYDEWLEGRIAEGLRDIEEGRTKPAKDVWKAIGLNR